jgi:hypothetical protein
MPQINLQELKSDKPQIKYHCAKRAIALSEKSPKALYPKLETFLKLLDGENNVLRWTALIVIGNLAAADPKGAIDRLVPKLTAYTRDPSLITAGNAAKALGKIAAYKPLLRNKIFKALLGMEKVTYYNKGKPSPECRNVLMGHLIDVFTEFKNEVANQKEVISFIKRQTKNTRPVVKKQAEILLENI